MQQYDNIDDLCAKLAQKVIEGGSLTDDEAYALADAAGRQALRDGAKSITRAFCSKEFDTCSIVNARSGRCSENCKWCAQSAHFNTGCNTYDLIDRDVCIEAAQTNRRMGIKRFSMVASGRAVTGEALKKIASMLHEVQAEGTCTCASLGLIGIDEMRILRQAGVSRYHCNLETAPSHFTKLCTTHTIDDKLRTIEAAHEAGLEVCSGGIIGMGETMRQRVEFALTLRRTRPVSIPINTLIPIPGTPLADMEPISEDEILDTVAIFRYIHPRVQLRFAGGRQRLSRQAQIEAMQTGINGAIIGDMLTTIGSTVAEDRITVAEAGYEF